MKHINGDGCVMMENNVELCRLVKMKISGDGRVPYDVD